MKALKLGCQAGVFVLALAGHASGQDSKSTALAKQLAAALDAAKLDSIAAQDPAAPDVFFGALYLPGVQLLVVSAKYTVPQLLAERLSKKEYRDVYIDLNSASVPDSKMFIEDLGADGLKAERESNRPFDSCEVGGKRTMFNNNWKSQSLSEQEYMKVFSSVDERYAQALAALLAELKKSS
jgi:hypothetical protein